MANFMARKVGRGYLNKLAYKRLARLVQGKRIVGKPNAYKLAKGGK